MSQHTGWGQRVHALMGTKGLKENRQVYSMASSTGDARMDTEDGFENGSCSANRSKLVPFKYSTDPH
jgi:hypothetical protein